MTSRLNHLLKVADLCIEHKHWEKALEYLHEAEQHTINPEILHDIAKKIDHIAERYDPEEVRRKAREFAQDLLKRFPEIHKYLAEH